jgi:hypothetical protein
MFQWWDGRALSFQLVRFRQCLNENERSWKGRELPKMSRLWLIDGQTGAYQSINHQQILLGLDVG